MDSRTLQGNSYGIVLRAQGKMKGWESNAQYSYYINRFHNYMYYKYQLYYQYGFLKSIFEKWYHFYYLFLSKWTMLL